MSATEERPGRALGRRSCAIEGCRAAPLKGGPKCIAHDEVARARTGFGGPEAGALGGRPRIPRSTEVLVHALREKVEPNTERIIGPLLALIDEPDPSVRLRAIAEIFDRVDGKAVARSEVSVDARLTLAELFVEAPNESTSTLLPEPEDA